MTITDPMIQNLANRYNLQKLLHESNGVAFLEALLQKITKAKEEYESLSSFPLENPNPVFRINEEGDMLFKNAAADTIKEIHYADNKITTTAFFKSIIGSIGSEPLNLDVETNEKSYSFLFVHNPVKRYYHIYGSDITERKKTELRAYDNFYRLNNFLENTSDTYYIFYRKRVEKNFFSSQWAALFGFNPFKVTDPLLSKHETLHPDSVTAYNEGMHQLDQKGVTIIKYKVINRHTGETFWLEEEIVRKSDAFLNDEITTGRIANITEKELYRLKMEESEQRFRNITDSLPVKVWVSNESNKVIYSNKRLRDFFGVGFEAMKDFTEYQKKVHPEFIDTAILEWQSFLHKKQPINLKYQVLNQSGEYRWVHELANPRFLADGTFIGYVGAIFDIHNEELYKMQLEEELKKLELISTYSTDITFITNHQGLIEYVSPTSERIVGYKAEELIQKNFSDLLCKECQQWTKPFFKKNSLLNSEFEKQTMRFKHHSGHLMWVENIIAKHTTGHGRETKYIIYVRDIDKEKKAFEALRESEAKYRQMFEGMHLGVMEVDLNETILYTNKAFQLISGYNEEELLRQNAITLFVPNRKTKQTIEKERKKRLEGKDSAYEISIQRKDGSLGYLIISGTPLYDTAGNIRGTIGIHWDVTSLRQMEQRLVDESIRKEREILEARLQAEEEQRSLIGNELHDSMGQKLGYIDLLLNIQKEQVETDQNLLAKIQTTVKTTIEEMRKLSRLLAPPSISNLGLREAVIELIESYSTFKRPKFHLEIYPTKLESKLQHDKKIMIYRVMQELINNSMKYGNPEQIKLNLQFVENKLIFLYYDDGIGFDAAKTVKGTGLKSIESRLNVYHGKMEIISSKGKGFKANLIIPTDK